jgi:F-type H+-transporting ATPase subunit epsilon
MSSTIKCDIVSARRQLFSGDVSSCIVTGAGGQLGVYPRHAPLMTVLKPGVVRICKADSEEITFAIGGGILEVMPHVITVLVDTAVRADDIDEAAAIRAKAEAERELLSRTERMEIAEAQAKLAEAVAQLRALEQLRRRLKRR